MTATRSQNERILKRLRRGRGGWVALPKLAEASGSLSPATRVSNLREQGHRIENRTRKVMRTIEGERVPVTISEYRLISPEREEVRR